jgi:hypothetical protein
LCAQHGRDLEVASPSGSRSSQPKRTATAGGRPAEPSDWTRSRRRIFVGHGSRPQRRARTSRSSCSARAKRVASGTERYDRDRHIVRVHGEPSRDLSARAAVPPLAGVELGLARRGRAQPRGRVGLRAQPPRRHRALCAPPRVPRASRGLPAARGSQPAGRSILLDPYLSLRTGSTPFWMLFNKQPSLEALREFLAPREQLPI